MKVLINNIKKKYNGKLVLNISSLEYKKGLINGIIGPNGSGKTTLMKAIANLVNPTEGCIKYNDNSFDKSIAKDITYMSHNSYLFNDTVRNNIAYPLKLRNTPKEETNIVVDSLIKEFKLSHVEDQNASKLSGGEAQKTALARAISFNPKLLLLDEPTSNVDPSFIKQIENIIVTINKSRNTTILIVTHNATQAFRICDNITFLNNGEVFFQGSKDDLLTCEDNFIKDFIEIY